MLAAAPAAEEGAAAPTEDAPADGKQKQTHRQHFCENPKT